jgi:hypothetical protein
MLLHLDKQHSHVFLGNGSSNDKIDGWYLDTGATHHMTGRREYFNDLDNWMRMALTTKTGEHRHLLHPRAEELHH